MLEYTDAYTFAYYSTYSNQYAASTCDIRTSHLHTRYSHTNCCAYSYTCSNQYPYTDCDFDTGAISQ